MASDSAGEPLNVMRCPQCEREDTSGAVFCTYCGTPLRVVPPQASTGSSEQGSQTAQTGEPLNVMRCPQCEREDTSGSIFCIYCGSPLRVVPPQTSTGSSEQGSETYEVVIDAQIEEMTQVLDVLTRRVSRLESHLSLPPAPPLEKPPEPVSSTPAQSPRIMAPTADVAEQTEMPLRPDSDDESEARQFDRGSSPPNSWLSDLLDIERVLGRNWFAILGAITLTLGVGFFLNLAFENEWIGPVGQIVLGVAFGIILLGVGEYTQRSYSRWAQAVTGAALGVLYLSIYAAFGVYRFIDPVPALLFLAIVVLLSGLLALRYESLVIALLSVAGAFVTPVLLATEIAHDQAFLLLGYILVVDVGIVGLATFRNWRWVTLVGLVGSYGLVGMWFVQPSPIEDLLLAQAGLLGIFLMFVGATTLFHVLWGREPKQVDLTLMILNAMAFFLFTFLLLFESYEAWFGLIALGLAIFYALIGYGAVRRAGTPPQVALFSAAISVVFLTIAVPLQTTGAWLTVAWAAEGAAFVSVGFVVNDWRFRAVGLGVLAASVFKLLTLDVYISLEDFQIILNERFLTFAVYIAALYVTAYQYWRNRDRLEIWEQNFTMVLVGSANLLSILILSVEIISAFEVQMSEMDGTREVWATNGQLVVLTAVWSVYATGLLVAGLVWRSAYLRWGGFGLLTLAVAKLLLIDTVEFQVINSEYQVGFNGYFWCVMLAIVAISFSAWLFWRQRDFLDPREWVCLPLLLAAANVLMVWILSLEALRFFDIREEVHGTNLESAKQLSLTILWAVYGVAVIVVGIIRQYSAARLAGIGLLAMSVLKLFAFDVFLLEQEYRVAAFISLGALLLGIGFAYQRYGNLIKGFLFGETEVETTKPDSTPGNSLSET
ncbi:MAG: DUF2339 domain-containing protein [Chloroflexota bacterium]|nr:DUF2339 domain-containing protein [Chloroflexota bacterium]